MSVHRLDEVCSIVMGQAPEGDSYNRTGDGLPLIAGPGDFGDQHPEPTKFTTKPTKVCAPGDIILGIRATIGVRVLADENACLGRGVAGLRPREGLHPRFLWHWLDYAAPALAGKARGATFKQVSREDIGSLGIDLPVFPDQSRIAAVMDLADSLRAKRRVVLERLQQIREALFVEMFGDPIRNSKEFPSVALRELVDHARPISYGILMPGPPQPTGVKYVRVVDMKDGEIDVANVRCTTPAISHIYRRSLLKTGDLLLSIRGHVGRVATVPPELDGANITQDSARLAISGADSIFVRECLRTRSVARWMDQRTKGVAVRGINLTDVKLIPVIVPPPSLQESFAERVAILDRLVRSCRHSIESLDALFASLQHRAFSGTLFAKGQVAEPEV